MINISVQQYSGGILPDIILLTQGYLLPVGNLFKYHVPGSGFVFIAFVMYITTTMCDGVLHCLWFVFNVFLVSLHGD